MTTRMTINGVSTCAEAGTRNTSVSNRVSEDAGGHLGAVRPPPTTGQRIVLVSNPRWTSAEPHGTSDERKEGKGGQTMNTTYQTLIVKFSEPIITLTVSFDDTGAWGTDTPRGG